MMRYSENVDKLLSYDEFKYGTWPNYLELGFTLDDVPALLQIVKDEELFWDEEEPARSTFYHACRVLGQLKAEEAILPLLAAINEDDDWSSEEAPEILGRIGEKAIEPTRRYLIDHTINEVIRIVLPRVFSEIAKNYPVCRKQCVEVLMEYLSQIKQKESSVAGFVVSALMDMSAIESLETMREAFRQNYIDVSISGDIEDIEIEFGLRRTRTKPRVIPKHIKELRETLKKTFDAEYDEDVVSNPVQAVKIGRNDPCPCGSGKKYKKCCLH